MCKINLELEVNGTNVTISVQGEPLFAGRKGDMGPQLTTIVSEAMFSVAHEIEDQANSLAMA